jgi:signal transduction histidine kinase
LLRAELLNGQSLETAIAGLVEDHSITTGIHPTSVVNLNTLLPTRIQVAIYRIVEEALTNIQKYSKATKVNIQIYIEPAPTASTLLEASTLQTDYVRVEIEDNGCGFHVEQNTTGFGIRGMTERAVNLGGQFQILSQPGHGCRVIS